MRYGSFHFGESDEEGALDKFPQWERMITGIVTITDWRDPRAVGRGGGMVRHRRTIQRDAVLAAVKQADHHPDAKWVFGEVSRTIPDISLGTVYRALASLIEEGLIREYRQVDGPVLYDPNTEAHDHIRCRRCDHIEDIPTVELPSEMIERVRRASGFMRVDRVRLEFGGLCSRCAEEISQVNSIEGSETST